MANTNVIYFYVTGMLLVPIIIWYSILCGNHQFQVEKPVVGAILVILGAMLAWPIICVGAIQEYLETGFE
jgi:hypothetical protein